MKANFKIHDVTTWLTNNSNTYIAQYFTKYREPETFGLLEFGQLIEYNKGNVFPQKSYRK